MKFENFYRTNVGKKNDDVFIIYSDEDQTFNIINNETFDALEYEFDSVESALEFVKDKNMNLVEPDPEYLELHGLTDDELDDIDSTYVDEYEDGIEYEEELTERLVRSKVIRNGQRMIKIKTDREGFKIVRDGKRVKEVRIKPEEHRRRLKAQKIAGRKRKAKSKVIQQKRQRSMKKRKGF